MSHVVVHNNECLAAGANGRSDMSLSYVTTWQGWPVLMESTKSEI